MYSALSNFKNAGLVTEIVQLFRLVAKDQFPLGNIAFNLAMDVVGARSSQSWHRSSVVMV